MAHPDLQEYIGEFVALSQADFEKAEVVAHDDRIHHAYRKAVEAGCERPVMAFVPQSDLVCGY